MEYTKSICSLFATQFTVESLISSDSQRLTDNVLVVYNSDFHTGKTILDNLTGKLNATNIKEFEINMFFD